MTPEPKFKVGDEVEVWIKPLSSWERATIKRVDHNSLTWITLDCDYYGTNRIDWLQDIRPLEQGELN